MKNLEKMLKNVHMSCGEEVMSTNEAVNAIYKHLAGK